MCSPSQSPLPPPSPSRPSGSSQCTSPEHLSHASNLGWWSVQAILWAPMWYTELTLTEGRAYTFPITKLGRGSVPKSDTVSIPIISQIKVMQPLQWCPFKYSSFHPNFHLNRITTQSSSISSPSTCIFQGGLYLEVLPTGFRTKLGSYVKVSKKNIFPTLWSFF